MKTTVLTLTLMVGLTTVARAQINRKNKHDNPAGSHSFYPDKKTAPADSTVALVLRDPRLPFITPAPKSLIDKTPGKTQWSAVDNMPFFIPKGNFTGRVVAPDSMVRYTMLVKKF
jgi:hypothetical protein